MRFRVVIEPTAERGIREAVRWKAAQSSPSAVARWYNNLIKRIETLKTHPLRYPLAAESDKFPEAIRELLHGKRHHKYRALFTIRADTVHVLYIQHSARDEIG